MANIIFNGFGGRRNVLPAANKAHMRRLQFGVPYRILQIICSFIPNVLGITDAQRFGYGRLLILKGDVANLENAFFDAGTQGFDPNDTGARQIETLMDVNLSVINQPIIIPFVPGTMEFQAADIVTVVLVNFKDNAGTDIDQLTSLTVLGDTDSIVNDVRLR